MSASSPESRLLAALNADTAAAAFWRGVRGADGDWVDLEVRECSAGFAAWLGRDHASIAGRRYSELIPTGLHDRLPTYLDALRLGKPAVLMFDRPSPTGGVVTAEVRATPISDDELFVALWDVTEREAVVREVMRDRARAIADRDLLSAALDSSPDGFAVYRARRDLDGTVVDLEVEFVNETAAAPTGRPPDAWRGASIRAWFPEIDRVGLFDALVEAVTDRRPRRAVVEVDSTRGWSGRDEVVITPFGMDLVIVEWWPEDAETPPGIDLPAASVVDARRDPLTGLLNRGEFRRRLAEWIQEHQSGDAGAVVVMDVDDFGRLNDLVGLHRADEVLVELADGIRQLEPWLKYPARIGTDACAAIVPGPLTDETVDLARAHATRLVRVIADRLALPPFSVSGGLRMIEAGPGVDEILRDCDTALRHSVRSGGARLTVFSSDVRQDLLAEYLAGEDIRAGLAAQQFRVAYQPVVRIDTGEHTGDEALTRWLHPELGLIMPGQFIQVAEATGNIIRLGEWLIDRVLDDLRQQDHDRDVGINVSAVQLLQSDLPSVMATALEIHQVPARRIIVEITESSILPDSTRIRDSLAQLRAMGVQVAIDDFGSGYSSIGYLDWIPVDIVKLDRNFLLGTLDRRRRNLVAATAQLIRSIGAHSLAEGIETQEQWDVVEEAGVDFGQGYMLGEPRLLPEA